MEQAVWFYVGIILAIMAIVGLVYLFELNKEKIREQASQNALTRVERMCNLVCNSAEQTKLDIDVDLASGSKAYSSGKAFCIDFKAPKCVQCDCPLEEFTLDLSDETAKQLFVIHPYKCFFEKLVQGSVLIECKG